MKPGFFTGLFIGFILAAGAMGWFLASPKVVARITGEAAKSADKPLITRDEKYIYFATTPDGRITKLQPLNDPGLSTSALVSWVSQAMTAAVILAPVQQSTTSDKSPARHFTVGGWQNLQAYMQAKGWTREAMPNYGTVMTAPRAAPKVLQQGVNKGVYRWVVVMELVSTIREQHKPDRQEVHTASVMVDRSGDVDSPTGLVISAVQAMPDRAR